MRAVRAFKIAVVDALKADAGVAVLVADRVFDVPPQDKRSGAPNVDSPYVRIGPIGTTRTGDECDGVPVWNLRMRIYAASYDADREGVWDVIAAIDDALDGATIAMPDGTEQVTAIETTQGGDIVDPTSPAQTFIDLTAMVAAA